MSDINQVRQVLMNELGLTRESVRGMAEDIVRDAVSKHVAKLLEGDGIKKMVRAEVDRIAAANRWDNDAMRRIIANAASDAVKSNVFSSLMKS